MVFNEIEVPKTNKQVLYRLTNYFDNKIKLANSSQVQSTKTSWRFALLFDKLLILIRTIWYHVYYFRLVTKSFLSLASQEKWISLGRGSVCSSRASF